MRGERTLERKDSVSVQLVHAPKEDIPELTRVMTLAFDDDSQKHLGKPKGGSPGYDNGDFFRKWMPYKESVTYKMVADGKTIGASLSGYTSMVEMY